MGIPKTIRVNGYKYYYWDNYDSREEANDYAQEIKKRKQKEGIKVKYFIQEMEDSPFLPVMISVLYFNKKLRIW